MSEQFLEEILDRIKLENVYSRAMFGGYGLYHWGHFFGIVYNSELYFKTSDSTRRMYERQGMDCFRPNETQVLKTFYQVPAHVVDSRLTLTEWAETAIQAASEQSKDLS